MILHNQQVVSRLYFHRFLISLDELCKYIWVFAVMISQTIIIYITFESSTLIMKKRRSILNDEELNAIEMGDLSPLMEEGNISMHTGFWQELFIQCHYSKCAKIHLHWTGFQVQLQMETYINLRDHRFASDIQKRSAFNTKKLGLCVIPMRIGIVIYMHFATWWKEFFWFRCV